MPTHEKNTLFKNAQANAESNFFKRVFFSPTQEATYTWNFGDGSFQNGSATTTHAYAEAGIYEAKLKVSFEHCEDVQVQTITVHQNVTGIEAVITGGRKLYRRPCQACWK